VISFRHKGDFSKLTKYLNTLKTKNYINVVRKYAQRGVYALASATPVDSGLTASSWYYKIKDENGRVTITFCNSNIQNGVMIAIILQYGHGTGTGGWVEGRDYINPSIQPIFDEITNEAWREVTAL
jgi:hypothetical protein